MLYVTPARQQFHFAQSGSSAFAARPTLKPKQCKRASLSSRDSRTKSEFNFNKF